MNQENEFLSWDSPFTAEESSFKLFQSGEYPFTVTGMDRKIYDGQSQSIPNGAPYAEVKMEFVGPEGKTIVTDRLYLMKNWQWKLTQFFAGIGQSPVIGQPFSPNWNMVLGSSGKAKLGINTFTVNGNERKNNQVEEYIAAPPTQNFNQPQAQTNQGQTPKFNQGPNFNQPSQQQANNYQPGAF